tara:strand:- start:3457 stop:3711 length:255 start_codon:yes stop_codon:yes gene_type:complete
MSSPSTLLLPDVPPAGAVSVSVCHWNRVLDAEDFPILDTKGVSIGLILLINPDRSSLIPIADRSPSDTLYDKRVFVGAAMSYYL